MTQDSQQIDRRLLDRSRALDYIKLHSLPAQTGCEVVALDCFALKELADNALDACNGANPSVEVSFESTDSTMTLNVTDKGSGISEESIKQIFDYNKFSSSKFSYKFPSRGALGNGLKVLAGLPYAVSYELGTSPVPLVVRSQGKEHNVCLAPNEQENTLEVKVQTNDSQMYEGTQVSLTLPRYESHWGKSQLYADLVRGYSIFNTNANIRLKMRYNGEEIYNDEFTSLGDIGDFEGKSSVHWYTEEEFKGLVSAIIRDISHGGEDVPLGEFIKQFKGMSSDKLVKEALRKASMSDIKHISDLTGQEELISKLYLALEEISMDPKPKILGCIGEPQIRERLGQLYKIEDFKYGIIRDVCREESHSIPFVLEVAVAKVPVEDGKRKIHVGINRSPCLYEDPFSPTSFIWESKQENEKIYGLRGLLQKARVDPEKNRHVVVIHLTCPNLTYQNYGKSQVSAKPFEVALPKLIRKVCSKIKKLDLGVGEKGCARKLLILELHRRQELLKKLGKIPESEWTTQQGLYYNIRSQMDGEIVIKRKSFISAIKEECIKMGGDLSYREKLGILAAERAQFFFRGKTYPVNWERIEDLAKFGSDVLVIEKEGVCQVLEPFAAERGIALLNTRGFATDYAKQLMGLSEFLKGKVFVLSDYDVSGLVLSHGLAGIPRIGVDLETLSYLGVLRKDVEEVYDTKNKKAPKKHLKALQKISPEEAKDVENTRVEIDAVLAKVGPEKLWEYLQKKMLELSPQRDLTRSMDLNVKLTPEIADSMTKITDIVGSIGAPILETIKEREKLSRWDNGFVNVEEKEAEINKEVIGEISKNAIIKKLSKQLAEIVTS